MEKYVISKQFVSSHIYFIYTWLVISVQSDWSCRIFFVSRISKRLHSSSLLNLINVRYCCLIFFSFYICLAATDKKLWMHYISLAYLFKLLKVLKLCVFFCQIAGCNRRDFVKSCSFMAMERFSNTFRSKSMIASKKRPKNLALLLRNYQEKLVIVYSIN